jgi:hypothetical protein
MTGAELIRLSELADQMAAGSETKRPDANYVASDLRIAPPGLEPGLS